MAHDVFISYSMKDKPLADAACATLEAKGIRCWIAPRDVLPGVPYAKSIINAIRESRILVLLFTANSNTSDHVMKEVERAVSKGLVILPFRVEDAPYSEELEYFIGNTHWLDALTPPVEKHLEGLAETVCRLLQSVAPREQSGESSKAHGMFRGDKGSAPIQANKPRLDFLYDAERGWLLRNIGDAPAIDVIVAQKEVNGVWFYPVRVPSLVQGEARVLTWLEHTNIHGLGAAYTDTNGKHYSAVCRKDRSQVFEERQFPEWKEQEITAHWAARFQLNAESAAKTREQQTRIKKCVLWVDDNPTNNAQEVAQLRQAGVKVIEAASTEEAMQTIIGWWKIDFIISDMGRRESGGYRAKAGLILIEAVRRAGIKIPIYVYTSTRYLEQNNEAVIAAGGNGATASFTELLSLIVATSGA